MTSVASRGFTPFCVAAAEFVEVGELATNGTKGHEEVVDRLRVHWWNSWRFSLADDRTDSQGSREGAKPRYNFHGAEEILEPDLNMLYKGALCMRAALICSGEPHVN